MDENEQQPGNPDLHKYPGDNFPLTAIERAEFEEWLDSLNKQGFDNG